MSNEITVRAAESNMTLGDSLPIGAVLQRSQQLKQLLQQGMTEGEHYGKIPGCGDKPALLKSGAEKICLLLQLCPSYDVERVDLAGGHREYIVKCSLATPDGRFVGQGMGSCSTMEGKYRYRTEFISDKVPPEFWQKRDVTLLGGPDHFVKKRGGQWVVYKRIEHDNPCDYYNVALKIAQKRAFVGATLSRTGASEVFVADVEDMADNAAVYGEVDPVPSGPAPKAKPASAPAASPEPAVSTPAETPAPTAPQGDLSDKDYGDAVIHFGKLSGKRLNEIPGNSLWWYAEKYEPKPFNGQISAKDAALKDAAVRYHRYVKSMKLETPADDIVP